MFSGITLRRAVSCGVVVAGLLGLSSVALGAVTTTLELPARSPSAMTGTQFYNHILNMNDNQREQAIINEIATGNIPSFLRTLKPITVNATISGVPRTTTYYVTNDYLAIGSDTDFFRMPMSAPLAQQVADLAGCSLTTRKMVNNIYTSAAVKLAPFPYNPANYDIDSVQVFWLHNQSVENQRAGYANDLLIGGIKKDVVISKLTATRPAPLRVCIYGWHQLSGSPIQPLSTVHENTYEDYSHGIRLVGKNILVDGAETTVAATLMNASTAALLSDEGTFGAVDVVYPVPNPWPLPGGPELILNGGFEGTYTAGIAPNWTSFVVSGTPTFGRASLNKYEGSYSQYWARTDTAAFDAGVRQSVTVTPGATYRIKGRFKRQSTFAGTTLQIGYDATGGTSATAGSVVYTSLMSDPDNTWAAYEANVVAASSTLTVFARAGHSGTTGGTNAYFYVDAVSVTEIAPAPGPTPTPTPTPTPSPTPTPTPSPTPAPPVNRIVNGSFEGGFTSGVGNSWTKFSTLGTQVHGSASVNKVDGSFSQYWSRSDTAAMDGGVYQVVNVTPGGSYTISAQLKRQSTFTGTSIRVGYDLSGGTNPTAGSVVYTDITSSTNNVWDSYSQAVTATGSTITVFLRGGHTGTTGGTNAYFYADAVSVVGP